MNLPATLWSIGRRFETLLASQDKIAEVLDELDERLRSVEDRMIRLEAAQNQLVLEARAAASAAATAIVGAMLSDIVTRLTRLEMRLGDGAGRLEPPASGP
jgi:ribulose 1,5-bisphosphate synthetase/thiazole synthase